MLQKLMLLTLALLFLQSCRVAPIQMARVTQIDSYKQTYNFKDESQAARALEKLMGQKNWEILIDYLGSSEYFQELQSKNIFVKGSFVMSITLNPKDHNRFLVEGFGRYYVVRNKTNEVLFSADYRIIEKQHTIDDFQKKKVLNVDVQHSMIRHFPTEGEKNFYHEAPFNMNIFVTSTTDGVYTLNYDKEHELVIDGEVVGNMYFAKSLAQQKLIDLRDMGYVKNDY
ncbi:hypothetical protein [Candidatus Uabimicrobium amorphum]|uniref:Lipoprotein n=1 Tax=Uabimicrobium amorphum TaxID=2596890 RepID=A0A5S9IV76_UABAM|nr:hypothetical protein [Candidatus Uabimicrobium amorphum]BBM87911.1 hypothetical protein UABAM_06326 [Candidatus Uabimicrobium amorphum]